MNSQKIHSLHDGRYDTMEREEIQRKQQNLALPQEDLRRVHDVFVMQRASHNVTTWGKT